MNLRYPKTTPWGDIQSCREISPGVFCVLTAVQTGVMVRGDLVDTALSPYARKHGFSQDGYFCFEGYIDSFVAIRDLMDKGLFQEPENDFLKPGEYSAVVDRRLKEHRPEYWRERQEALSNTCQSVSKPKQRERGEER